MAYADVPPRDPLAPPMGEPAIDFTLPASLDGLLAGSTLVAPQDRDLVPDYLLVALAQMVPCRLSECDRIGPHKARPVGFTGLCCRHCGGGGPDGSGRYFPTTVRNLAQTTTCQTIVKHVGYKCRSVPENVRSAVVSLQRNCPLEKISHHNNGGDAGHNGDCANADDRPKYGSRKVFFQRVWNRLHGKDNEESSSLSSPARLPPICDMRAHHSEGSGDAEEEDEDEEMEQEEEEDDSDQKPPAAAASPGGEEGGVEEPSQDVLESAVDDLMTQVAEANKNSAAAAAADEQKKTDEKKNDPCDEEAPPAGAEATRQKLIRHQLLQRIKMACQAGISPAEYTERFMAQIRINQKREEEEAQKEMVRRRAVMSGGEKSNGDDEAKLSYDGDNGTDEGKEEKNGAKAKTPNARIKVKMEESDSERKAKKAKTAKRQWTEEEVAKLKEGIEKFGRNWVAVANHVGTRNKSQCKSRNQTMDPEGSPSRCKGQWTDEEVAKLKEGIEMFGRNWVAVADHVGTRNKSQCRSRNQTIEMKEHRRTRTVAASRPIGASVSKMT